MKKINILFLMLLLNGCSPVSDIYGRVFVKKEVNCPKLSTPNGTAELIANSEDNNIKSYIGFRGIKKKCLLDNDEIKMSLLVNIRSIRTSFENDNRIPLKISLVSTNDKGEEHDRDDYEFKLFLKSGSEIVERETNMFVSVPVKGKAYIGLFKN